jgi:TetR/AcrR family transcriptional regulator, transcriptional repressor for nem operon
LERLMKAVTQPRAVETREKILGEAARLFALKGYHDTKLEEVLKAAQVTTGAFFHHFSSKEDLGFAVIDRHMEKRRQRLEKIEQRLPRPDEDDPLQCVFRRLDAIQEMIRRRERRKGGCIIGNLSTALSDTHDAFRQRLAQCFDEMEQEFRPHLAAAAARHGAATSVDAAGLARYIVAIIEGSIMLTRTQQDRHLMARHFDYLKEHLKQACGARGTSEKNADRRSTDDSMKSSG